MTWHDAFVIGARAPPFVDARAPPFDHARAPPFDCEVVFRVNLTPVTRGISFFWKSTFCMHKTQQAKASKLVLLWFCSAKKNRNRLFTMATPPQRIQVCVAISRLVESELSSPSLAYNELRT
jgi:hypothetical protein